MAQTATALGAKITANAAAVATAMAGGTTTAEAQALGALVSLLGARPDFATSPLMMLTQAQASQITPG